MTESNILDYGEKLYLEIAKRNMFENDNGPREYITPSLKEVSEDFSNICSIPGNEREQRGLSDLLFRAANLALYPYDSHLHKLVSPNMMDQYPYYRSDCMIKTMLNRLEIYDLDYILTMQRSFAKVFDDYLDNLDSSNDDESDSGYDYEYLDDLDDKVEESIILSLFNKWIGMFLGYNNSHLELTDQDQDQDSSDNESDYDYDRTSETDVSDDNDQSDNQSNQLESNQDDSEYEYEYEYDGS